MLASEANFSVKDMSEHDASHMEGAGKSQQLSG